MTSASLSAGTQAVSIVALTIWSATAVLEAERQEVAVTCAVISASALWLRQRAPVAALAISFVGFLALITVGGFDGAADPLLLVLMWSNYLVGRTAPLRMQPWAGAATVLFVVVNVFDGDLVLPGDVVFPVVIMAAPWLLGLAIGLTDDRATRTAELVHELAETREHDVRREVLAERLRLAREIHDVMAHHLSGASLQVQALRRRTAAGATATVDELEAVEKAVRAAMDELRRVMGVFRSSAHTNELAPQPGFDRLPDLISDCGRIGQSIDLVTTGTPHHLPTGLSLSAYRIVQEALSNARCHGLGATVCAEVDWRPTALHLRVSNPAPDRPGWTMGHGLVGMQERTRLFAGKMTAGPDGHGAWVVDVTLPVRP